MKILFNELLVMLIPWIFNSFFLDSNTSHISAKLKSPRGSSNMIWLDVIEFIETPGA